jgi:hypothetical protein
MEVGGTIPSSMHTSTFGGANVTYKLRATAIRPGLAHNLTAAIPVPVLRGFGTDALEYQQTLEIENTWPEKLMYSILLPHKAWALGDTVSAVMKFQPIAKGAKVLSVATTINETVKLGGRSVSNVATQEVTRAVVSTKHDIKGGRAVEIEKQAISRFHRMPASNVPGPSVPRRSEDSSPGLSPTPQQGPDADGNGYFQPSVAPPAEPSSSNAQASDSTSTSVSPSRPQLAGAQDFQLPEDLEPSDSEVVTILTIPLPTRAGISPSHSLEPIHVNHRIRWSILIGNADGHTSELRCSLPMHVLDPRLLAQARASTAATRRLILGEERQEGDLDEEDIELPSYSAHVRDRVANMYVPDNATVRVTAAGTRTPHTNAMSSGLTSPDPDGPGGFSLPPAPGADAPNALEWVNTELRSLSFGQNVSASSPRVRQTPPESHSTSASGSHRGSRHPSRPASRTSSPERITPPTAHPSSLQQSHMQAFSSLPSTSPPSSTTHPTHPPASASTTTSQPQSHPVPEPTFVHTGPASRTPQGVFAATMRPLTSLASSLSSSFGPSSRSGSQGSLSTYFASHAHAGPTSHALHSHGHSHSFSLSMPSTTSSGTGTPATMERRGSRSATSDSHDLQSARETLTRVPDYASSSHGFLGGVPPLSSSQGLPSYTEAERLRSA